MIFVSKLQINIIIAYDSGYLFKSHDNSIMSIMIHIHMLVFDLLNLNYIIYNIL